MDLTRQYENIGRAYIDGQRSFFSSREDWARKFIMNSISPLKDKAVLDLGCGHGVDIQQYHTQGAIAYGVDLSPFMVDEAKKRVENPALVQVGDIQNLPYADETFDVVVSRYGFHYVENLEQSYREASRVLKHGGLLALILPHPIYDAVVMRQKYGDKFTVEIPLYDGKVTVTYPSHTLNDYLSQTFNELFHLEQGGEFLQEEVKEKQWGIPSAIGLVAKRL